MTAAADFLASRWQGAPPGLHILLWRKRDRRSLWLPVERLAAPALAPLCRPEAGDVYFGAGLAPKDYGPSRRCPAGEIAGIAGLWADIDIADEAHARTDLPATVEEAQQLARCLGLPPSEEVHSGHGLQCWWLFGEPWVFGDEGERQQAAELVERWQGALRRHAQAAGWHLDATHDLARILRFPGTWNCKTEPVEVRLLTSAGPRYSQADLCRVLAEDGPAAARTDGRPSGAGSVEERARRYVARMPPAVSGQGGHQATYAVAQVLVRGFGLGVDQARPILQEYSARCQPPWSDAELAHKLRSAEEQSRLPRGYLLQGRADRNGHARSDGQVTRQPPPRRDDVAQGTSGYDVILRYFVDAYDPVFRRGTAAFSARLGREVKATEACFAPPRRLIEQLAAADDAPRNKDGVRWSALPSFFTTWSKSAWVDLLASLPEEERAEVVSPDAEEQFRQHVTVALRQLISLGETIHTGQQTATRVERRSLLDWCCRFARSGPWKSIRSYRIWCRTVPTPSGMPRVEVALRAELFGQLGYRPLAEISATKFARLCEAYGVGDAGGRVQGERAIVLAPGFLDGLLSDPNSPENHANNGAEKEQAPCKTSKTDRMS